MLFYSLHSEPKFAEALCRLCFLGISPPSPLLGIPPFQPPPPPWPQGTAASLTQCCQNVVSSTCFRNYHSSWKVFFFFKIIIDFIILLKGSIMSRVVYSVTKDGLNRGAHSTIFPDPIPSNPMNPSHFQHQSGSSIWDAIYIAFAILVLATLCLCCCSSYFCQLLPGNCWLVVRLKQRFSWWRSTFSRVVLLKV